MSKHLVLEVISGPMDGLKSTVTGKKAGIGRGVGNTLTLPLDMYVSRPHASIVLEGHHWCLVEIEGKTGTWLSGKKLKPRVSYPLTTGQVILMGTTVIDVRLVEERETNIALTDDCFLNPFSKFEIAPDLSEIWYTLTKNSKKRYIGVEDVFNAAMASIPDAHRYSCVTDISSDINIKCLGRWLLEFFPCAPNYKIDENILLITPRLLAVMAMASQGNTQPVDLTTLISAIIEESGSLSARYILKDKNYMLDYPELIVHANDPVQEDSVEDVDDTETVQDTDTENSIVTNFDLETIDLMPDDSERLLKRVCALETLVLGFLEDAAGHRTTNTDFFLPGYTEKLMELYADGYTKAVDAYIDRLYQILVGILAAQRDAARDVEAEIHNRVKRILENFSDKKTNRIFKKMNPDAVSNMVLSVLKEAELEQLADCIIRTKIKQLLDRNILFPK